MTKLKTVLNNILKTLKILFIISFISLIILLTSIYLSSLGSYKEDEFNIASDFLNTRHYSENPYSENNWFIDFKKFNDNLGENLNEKLKLSYFDLLSKCTFKDKRVNKLDTYNKEYCKEELDKMIKNDPTILDQNSFNQFKNFITINSIKYKKINEKDFILHTPEYTWIKWENISYLWLIKYSRAIRYVSYYYFEEWEYEKWINILLNYQNFIDNLINKADADLILSLIIISISDINLNTINYFIDNYELDDSLKYIIYSSLDKQISEWLVNNWIINECNMQINWYKDLFDYISNESIKSKIESFLFLSINETKLLRKIQCFENINNKNFIPPININNYIWRTILKWSNSIYKTQQTNEKNIRIFRENILKKLKID